MGWDGLALAPRFISLVLKFQRLRFSSAQSVIGLASFSSTNRRLGIRSLPIVKIARPVQEVVAKTKVTGIMVCESKIPMLADARPETPICRNPSMADALP